MNELENQLPDPIEPVNEENSQLKEEQVSVSEKCDNESVSEECAEETSPSLDLAETADRITEERKEEKKGDDNAVNYHHMSKTELRDSLKEIIDSGNLERHKEVATIKQAFYSLHNKELATQLNEFVEAGNAPENFVSTPDETETEMKSLLNEFREKRNVYLEEKEEQKKKNLEEKKRIIKELNDIADDIDNVNLHYSKFQQLQQDFKNAGEVPASDESEIWKNFQAVVELFYDRLKMNKELRDLNFKKNLELKTLLVEKAKQLADMTDPVEAFKILQGLHSQWREIGPVARELREEIWNNFKDATTVINKRHQDYFQERKANEQVNEEAKTVLCEKAEQIKIDELKNFNDWDNATKEIINLQQEWKSLGFASRKANNQLFARFRKVCDDFFTAKAEFFKKTKEESRENLAKKEALCVKAEALLDRIEDRKAFEELQQIQKEWKTIGVVRKKQGDEIWKRFCAAVDAFYDGRKKLFSGKREEENANLEIKKNIIEELRNIPDTAEKSEVESTIRELRDKWQETGFVPIKQKDTIYKEYRAELDRLYNAFNIRENRQRINRYANEVKKFEGDESKIGKERDKLLRAIESRQLELKTIENNLGFFNFKTTAGNSMMKDYEKKIQKLKDEIDQIKEKIKLLDNPSAVAASDAE